MNESITFYPTTQSFFRRNRVNAVQITERMIYITTAQETISLDWIYVNALSLGKQHYTLHSSKGDFMIPNQFSAQLGKKLVKWATFYQVALFFESNLINPHQYLVDVPNLEVVS